MRSATPRRVHGRRALAITAAITAVVAVCSGCRAHATTADAAPAERSARAFFTDYVESDGRVVRTDQNNDTVSEGQAYALLLAVATHDRRAFDLVWSWTRANLQRPDKLLAYHWQNGAIVDADPAPDADLDTAVALFEAAAEFGESDLRTDAAAIAQAVLTYESVTASPGALVTAGTWAVADPAILNPSYLVPGTALYLAQQTGNGGWRQVAAATAQLDRQLATSYLLPPDWAALPRGAAANRVVAHGAPDGSAGPQYGMEAPRLIIRLAASCSPADRALAADYANRLGNPGRPGEQTLAGSPLVEWRSPLTDLALYAARTAAGDARGAASALRSAQALENSYPTYYGAAWLALAPTLLTADQKDCS